MSLNFYFTVLILLKMCITCVIGGIVLLGFLHRGRERDLSQASDVQRPRYIYSSRRVNSNAAVAYTLAKRRLEDLNLDGSQHSTSRTGLPISTGCSSLFPADSPSDSCWIGPSDHHSFVHSAAAEPSIQMKVSILDVQPGQSISSALNRIMQKAVEQASIDAETEALGMGMSSTEAQNYAEKHKQQLLKADAMELAVQNLPTYDIGNLESHTFLGGGLQQQESADIMSSIPKSLLRNLIKKLELVADIISERDDDEYEDPPLADPVADADIIDSIYKKLLVVPSIYYFGHVACARHPRLAPVPLKLLKSPNPWHLKVLSGRTLTTSGDKGGHLLQPGVANVTHHTRIQTGSPSTKGNLRKPIQTDKSSTEDTSSEDNARVAHDVWESGNKAQERVEDYVEKMQIEPVQATNYARERLAQVSKLSQELHDGYHQLFLQRAQAKHVLFEEAYDAADSQLHDPQVMAQMKRVLSITQFSLGPRAEAHKALDTIWRTFMHTAIQQTQAITCTSICGHEAMCYERASRVGKPAQYDPLAKLHPVQYAEVQAIVETIFNATVPLPPVRPPVLHWDPRIDGSTGRQVLWRNHSMEYGSDVVSLWVHGKGEPRQDAWQIAAGLTREIEPDDITTVLQRHLVQHFLALQATQLLEHIDEWDLMLEPDSIKYVSFPARRRKGKSRWQGHATSLELAKPDGELLAAMLRSRLEVMSSEGHKGWDEQSTGMSQVAWEEMQEDPAPRSTGAPGYDTSDATEDGHQRI